jgi:hypothetical protein
MGTSATERRGALGGYALLWLAMMLLRQDFWFWDDATLILGRLPVGLAYQAGYSILAALVMGALVRWCWPSELEALETASAGRAEPSRDGA